jgi:hypothetical protein
VVELQPGRRWGRDLSAFSMLLSGIAQEFQTRDDGLDGFEFFRKPRLEMIRLDSSPLRLHFQDTDEKL